MARLVDTAPRCDWSWSGRQSRDRFLGLLHDAGLELVVFYKHCTSGLILIIVDQTMKLKKTPEINQHISFLSGRRGADRKGAMAWDVADRVYIFSVAESDLL